MVSNKALEERITALERSMGTVVKALKEINLGMKELQEQNKKEPSDAIEDILESKRLIEENLVKHNEAIEQIEKDIAKIEDKIKSEGRENDDSKDVVGKGCKFKQTKCRYFDKGFCKYKSRCKFFHPSLICSIYERNGNCEERTCLDRHPETCKFWLKERCNRNEDCDFFHGTFASNDESSFKCVGCKNSWTDRSCVVKHTIDGNETFFCLNCQDWVKYKTRVYDPNWTLYDEDGYLKSDV